MKKVIIAVVGGLLLAICGFLVAGCLCDDECYELD